MKKIILLFFGIVMPSMMMAQTHGLDFNGSNQTAGRSGTVSGVATNFTIEFWVNPRTTTTLHSQSTTSIDGTANSPEYALYPAQGGPNGGVGVAVGSNGVVVYGHGDGFLPPLATKAHTINDWHHVAIVVNNNTPYIYINGQLVHTGLQSPRTLIPSLTLGGGSYGYFNGQMDEFRVWNVAKTQQQIEAMYYTNQIYPSDANLVTYYELNEGSGTSINDSSPTNLDGTTNATWVSLPNSVNDNGLDFDGVDDYVSIANDAAQNLSSGSEGTYEIWFKTSNAGSGYRGLIIRQFAAGMFLEDNKLIAYDWSNGTAHNTGVTLNDGNWHHAALAFKIGEANGSFLYVDGELVKTFTINNVTNGSGYATVFGAGDPSGSIQQFAGQLDDPKIWNVRRTQAQIQASQNQNIVGNESGLLAAYYFQAVSGNLAYDRTPANRWGTLTNMDNSDWISANKPEISNTAIDFDGSSERLEGASAQLPATFTLEAWVNSRDNSSARSIFRKAGDYDLYINNGVLTAEVWEEGSSSRRIVTGPTISQALNEWTHLAFTWNSGTGIFYVNGVQTTGSTSGFTTVAATSDLGIGGSILYGQHFNGLIDEVRIWNRVKSKTEIIDDVTTHFASGTANLVGYYTMNSTSGGSMIDLSGNGYNLSGNNIDFTDYSASSVPIVLDPPPSFENNTPSISDTGESNIRFEVDIDQSGTIYYTIQQGGVAPSASQVKAGTDGSGSANFNNGSINLSSGSYTASIVTQANALQHSSSYVLYVIAEDANGNQTSVISRSFTTNPDNYPQFINSTPSTSNITESSFDLKVDLSFHLSGSVPYVVLNQGSPAPNSSQIQSGTDGSNNPAVASGQYGYSAEVNGISSETKTISGLQSGSGYQIYFRRSSRMGLEDVSDPYNLSTLDNTPPVFENNTPSISSNTGFSFNIDVDLNEAGIAYFVLVPDGESAPSITQVKAGQKSNGSAALSSGSQSVSSGSFTHTFSASNLFDNTAYDVYVVAQDDEASPNVQSSPTKRDVTTPDINSSVSLDGASEYFSGTNNNLPSGNSSFTVEAWIYPDQMGNLTIARWGGSTGGRANAFRLSNSGLYHYWWANDFGVPTGNLTGAWHHVATTWDGTTRKIYLDGNLIGSQTPTAPNVQLGNFYVGAAAAGVESFDGKLDELRIWNTARTQSQIQSSLASSFPAGTSNLVAYYKMDGTSSKLVDFSGNGNHLNGGGIDASNWGTTSPFTPGPEYLAPIYENGTPSSSSIGETSFTVTVDVNEPGAVFLITLPDGSTAPNSAEVIAGTGHNGQGSFFNASSTGNAVAGTGTWRHTFNVAGLTAGNNYDIYVVARDDESTPNVQGPTRVDVRTIDNTAPIFENSTPSANNITTSTLNLNVDMNEPSTVYYVVVPDGESAPSSAQIKSGQKSNSEAAVKSGSQVVSTGGFSHSFAINGLNDATAYDVYLVAQDDESTPNVQSSGSKIDVTTVDLTAAFIVDNQSVNTTSFNFDVQASHTGTLHYKVLDQFESVPTESEIVASPTGTVAITTANTNFSESVTGLSHTSTYKIYYTVKDNNANAPWNQTQLGATVRTAIQGAGKALLFSDVYDYIVSPSEITTSPISALTVEAWITSNATNSAGTIMEEFYGNNGRIGFSLRSEWGRLILEIGNGGATSTTVQTPAGVILQNKTYHVAAVYDGSNVNLYVNGILITSEEHALGTIPYDTNRKLSVGGSNFAGNFKGTIDEVRVWNVARSANQIKTAISSYLVGNESGLIAYLPLDYFIDVSNVYNVNKTSSVAGAPSNNLNENIVNSPAFGSANGAPTFSADAVANADGFTMNIEADQPAKYYWVIQEGQPTEVTPANINTWITNETTISNGTHTLAGNTGSFQITGLDHSKVYQIYMYAETTSGDLQQSYVLNSEKQTTISYPGQSLKSDSQHHLSASGSFIGSSTYNLSVEAWVNPSQLNSNQDIISEFVSNSGYVLRAYSDGSVAFLIGTGSIQSVVAPAGSVPLNQWTHIAGVLENISGGNGELKIYINGVLKNKQLVTGSVSIRNESAIGNGTGGAMTPFIGLIDEVRVWNKSLTQSEIYQGINSSYQTPPSGLVQYYNFDAANLYGTVSGTGNISLTPTSPTTPYATQGNGLFVSNNGFGYSPEIAANSDGLVVVDLTTDRFKVWIDINQAATVYYVVLPQGATAPSASQIKAGNGNGQSVITSGSINLSSDAFNGISTISGLSENTSYSVFLSAEDASSNQFLLNSSGLDITTLSSNPSLGSALVQTQSTQKGYLQDANAILNGANSFTIEAIINPSQLLNARIIDTYNSGQGFILETTNTGALRFNYLAGKGLINIGASANLEVNKWQHIAVAYDASSVRFYVNGQEVDYTGSPGTINVNGITDMGIGGTRFPLSSTNTFLGKIDEVRIWNKKLTPSEIEANVGVAFTGSDPNLKLRYSFDQVGDFQTSYKVYDHVSNSPNLKMYGYNSVNEILEQSADNLDFITTIALSSISSTSFSPGSTISLTGAGLANVDASDEIILINPSTNQQVVTLGTQSKPTSVSLAVSIPSGVDTTFINQPMILAAKKSGGNMSRLGSLFHFERAEVAARDYMWSFNGDVIKVPDESAFTSGNRTYELWFKTSNAGSGYRALIVKPNALGLFLKDNKLAAFDWTVGDKYISTENLNDGKWHHVAIASSIGAVNGTVVYLDGNQVATFQQNVSNDTSPVFIGASDENASSQAFSGFIEDVRIWNTKRTFNQIVQNTITEFAGTETGLLASYRLDSKASEIAFDYSQNQHHATIEKGNGSWLRSQFEVVFPTEMTPNSITSRTFSANSTIEITDYKFALLESGFSVDMKLKEDESLIQNFTNAQRNSATISIPIPSNFSADKVNEAVYLEVINGQGSRTKISNVFQYESQELVDRIYSRSFSGDYIKTQNIPAYNSASATYELWFKATDAGAAERGLIVKPGEIELRQISDRFLNLIDLNGNVVKFSTSLTTNQWTHVALVFNQSAYVLYINGVQVHSNSLSRSINNTPVHIGSSSTDGSTNLYSGLIDEVRIFNDERTPGEILSNYNRTISSSTPNLISYYKMDSKSGSFVFDYSPNQNHASILSNSGTPQGSWQQDGFQNSTTPVITMSAGYPVVAKYSSTTAEIGVKLEKQSLTGQLYYVVLPENATAPDASQIKAGNGNGQTVNYSGSTTFTSAETTDTVQVSGLMINSNYRAYFAVEDAFNRLSLLNSNGFDFSTSSNTLNKSISLNGVNQYGIVNDMLHTHSASAFSIEAIINPSQLKDAFIIDALKNYIGYSLQLTQSGALKLTLGINQSTVDFTTPSLLVANKWYHISATYNGSDIKIYLNGKNILSDTNNFGSITLSSAETRVGIGNRPSQFIQSMNFEGLINEARFWDIALTESQINTNLGKPLTSSDQNLKARFSFDQIMELNNKFYAYDYGLNTQNLIVNGHASAATILNPSSPASNAFSTIPFPSQITASTVTNHYFNPGDTVKLTNGYHQYLDGNYSVDIVNNKTSSIVGNTSTVSYSDTTISVVIPTNVSTTLINEPVKLVLKESGNEITTYSNYLHFEAQSFDQKKYSRMFNAEYVSLPNSAQFEANDATGGTYELWFRTGSIDPNYQGLIVKQFAVGIFLADHKIEAYDWVSGTRSVTTETFNDAKWHHVALTFGSGTYKIYIDGNLYQTTSYSLSNNNNPINIGTGFANGSDQFYFGQLDEVRIWNRVRTAEEIGTYYDKPITDPDPNLISYLRLDSKNDVIAFDYSQYQNHVPITNAGSTQPGSWILDSYQNATAPIFENNTPQIGTISAVGFDLDIDINKAGTVYYVVVPDGETAPSSTQVKAGQKNDGSSAIVSGNQAVNSGTFRDTLSVAGLNEQTSYDVYVVAEDGSATPKIQSLPTKLDITTIELNTSVSLDGSTEYFSGTNANLPIGNSPFTIESWIKPDQMGTRGILGWGNYGTNNQVNAFRLDANHLFHYFWAEDLLVDVGSIANGWHHVAVTYDGTVRSIYLDGVVIATDTPGVQNVQAGNFTVGATYSGSEKFDGGLDRVRIWSAARTQSEIISGMTNTFNSGTANLVANYRMDGSASTLTDFSGNGNDLAGTGIDASNWVEPSTFTPAPEFVAPKFENGTPSGSAIALTTFTITVDVNEQGPVSLVVVPDGATAPTSAHVKAGTGNGEAGLFSASSSGNVVPGTGTWRHVFNITGMQESTLYDVYVVAEDDEATPNVQASATKVDVSTLDGTASVFENSTPLISNATLEGFDVSGDINESGTLYYVVLPKLAPAPTSAQVLQGQNASSEAALASGNQAVSTGDFSHTFTITGLSEKTEYDVYVATKDASDNTLDTPVKRSARTRALPVAKDSSLVFADNIANIFDVSGFGFSDEDDGEQLEILNIVGLPSKGTFFLDINDNGENDDSPLSAEQNISRADLVGNRLRFKANPGEYGKAYTTFTYRVGDGSYLSQNEYTMTIDVHATQEEVAGTNGFNGWRMVGAPSTDDSFASLLSGMWTQGGTGGSTTSGSPNIYVWNEVTGIFDPVTDFTATVSNGQGMIAFMFEDDNPATVELDGGWPKVINHSGTNKVGTTNFPVTYTDHGNSNSGFNLVANPYPFAIEWNAEGWTKTNISSSIYVWNPNANGGNGGYELWNGITGSRGNGILAPYQAFWVQAMGENPVLSVDESAGLSTPATLQKSTQSQTITESDVISIGIEIEQGMLSDNLQLLFHQNDSLELSTFDAVKLPTLAQKYVQISADEHDQSFAIKNYLSPNDINSVTFPIDIQTSNNESVRISVSEIANIPEHWEPTLVDTYTGEIFDLSGDEDYWEITFNKSTFAKSAEAESDSLIQPSMEIMEEEENGQPRFILALSSAVVTSLSESFLPQEFKLNQNYPNPFNPTTIIGYELPQAGHVTMEVYNIIGQKVTTLVNSTQSAGKHKIQFNGSQMTSGVYFVRMIAGKKVFTKKMVLVK